MSSSFGRGVAAAQHRRRGPLSFFVEAPFPPQPLFPGPLLACRWSFHPTVGPKLASGDWYDAKALPDLLGQLYAQAREGEGAATGAAAV